MHRSCLALLPVAALLAGCATRQSAVPGQPRRLHVEVATPGVTEWRVARPPDPAPPTGSAPAAASTPLWKDAEIAEVELDAYVNERGELIAPTRKWVVRRPGGWDLATARRLPDQESPLPGAPAHATFTEPAARPSTAVSTSTLRRLLPAGAIRTTGWFDRGDRVAVAAALRPGEVAVFDAAEGWLAVDRNALSAASGH